MTFAWEVEVRLLRWSESSTAGRTITLEIPPDAGEAHPFRGLPTGHQHGQRFRMAFIAIDDNEEPAESAIAVAESRPPDADGPGTPGGANLCPGDNQPCYVDIDPDEAHWRCGTVQCGRKDSSGRSVHQKDLARSAASRARYDESDEMQQAVTRAALLAKDQQFQAWVNARDEKQAASFIRRACGEPGSPLDSRSEIGADYIAHAKWRKLEAEFAEAAGRLAERRG